MRAMNQKLKPYADLGIFLMTKVNVVVIGGGIHGCAAAALAAAKGLSVFLAEKDDFASKTSSASTKLIHGGLRYLEQGAFRLVKQSLHARKFLLQNAPHLVHPLPFILPYTYRPEWQVRLGLFLYDLLAPHQTLPKSQTLSRLASSHLFTPLKSTIQKASLYFDAQTDDARLTLENALQAKQLGALLRPHTRLTSAVFKPPDWHLTFTPKQGRSYTVQTQAIINTSGAWINETHDLLQLPHPHEITLVKGSHLILPSLYSGQHAYVLPHEDKRIIFCMPYHGYTLIGTTDSLFEGNPENISISETEADYLCETVRHYFKLPFQHQDILHHFSGARTLITNPKNSLQTLKREASICMPSPSVVSLYGGKLTTHQFTAEALIHRLKPLFPQMKPSTLYDTPFPGAATPDGRSYLAYVEALKTQYSFLPQALLQRYINQYGTRTDTLLQKCESLKSLGKEILPGLFTREIEFLCNEEWALTAEDILWRRTKLGLHLDQEAAKRLQQFLSA